MTRDIRGVGVGVRREFVDDLLRSDRAVDFIEVVPENWVLFGGRKRLQLEACMERWPSVPHSVSLSIGGGEPLDPSFLRAIGELCRRAQAPFFSDHVCYSSVGGGPVHDLLPLPFTEEAVDHVAARIRQAQEAVGLPLVLENATFYAHMPGGQMDEARFLREVIIRGGCGMLLDVNNVYVNSVNHGFDPRAFMDRMPFDLVRQIHLAGHTLIEEVVIDTHIGPVIDPVWDLYRYTLQRAGRMIPTLIEWDQDIPPLAEVLDEVDRARAHAQAALAPQAAEGAR